MKTSADRGDVLVFGNYKQTIVVIRSLASAGYGVVVANERNDGKREFTEFSKYVSDVWRFPNPIDDGRFCDELCAYLKGPGRRVKFLFPVGEVSLKRLAEASPRLERLATLVMPPAATALLCLDKSKIYARADALRIPVPPVSEGTNRAQWKHNAAEWGLPVIFKRKDSFDLVQGKKALIVRTESELVDFLRGLDNEPDPSSLLMQKYIRGDRHNCNIASVGGKITAFLTTKTLRTDVPDGTGYGVEATTVAVSDEMRRHCDALVADLHYTGVCTIQFLLDPAGFSPYFLEINPRLDAFCGLPMFAGYDFPRIALECAMYSSDGPLPGSPTDPEYPIHMRAYWLYGDLFGLNQHFRRLPVIETFKWAARIILALVTHRRHLTWQWDDPLPTLYLYYVLVVEYAVGFRRRLSRAF